MNFAFVVLLSASLCEANQFLCQLFEGKTNTFEKYCENYDGIVSEYCINMELNFVEPFRVERLRISGCNADVVLNNIKKFQNISLLDISHSNFRTLNWLHLKLRNLKQFNASHNELSYVRTLLTNTTVTEVDLSYNKLINIGAETFGNAEKLTKIHLSHNFLEHIAFDTFMQSHNLRYIDLRNNQFLEIPLIQHTKKLKVIHLENNPIERYNYCYLSLMRPVSLYFAWENMKNVWRSESCQEENIKPARILLNSKYQGTKITPDGSYEMHCNEHSFRNLNNFTAGRNAFTNIADLLQIFGPLVMHLDLSENFIGKLDSNTFERFHRLITLSLSHTLLTDIDFSMLHPKYLMHLDISHNQLHYMNNASLLENFHSLTIFNVSGNQLENVPELIQYLSSSIHRLDLSGNYIGALHPNIFERLPSLNILNLRNTSLSISDFRPFKSLEQLNVLDISLNNLKGANFTQLSTINKLSQLNVAFCQIENVSSLTQHLGAALRILNLSGNTVRRLNAQTFATLSNLESLNLSKTNMQSIEIGAFQHQRTLRQLDLANNHLQEVNFAFTSNYLISLNLAANDLTSIQNFDRTNFYLLRSLDISHNQLSCRYLRDFMAQWKGIQFINDSIIQNHNKNCRSSAQGVQDFLDTVYDSIKFW